MEDGVADAEGELSPVERHDDRAAAYGDRVDAAVAAVVAAVGIVEQFPFVAGDSMHRRTRMDSAQRLVVQIRRTRDSREQE